LDIDAVGDTENTSDDVDVGVAETDEPYEVDEVADGLTDDIARYDNELVGV